VVARNDPNDHERLSKSMKDLTSVFWIKVKGLLFLLMGVAGAVLLWLDDPRWQTAILLGVVIWSFCRFYYFAFYVIEKYVDSRYKFSGLVSFARYLMDTKRKR
jgi:hypothetical protein